MHPFASAGAVMATSASVIAAHPKILFMSLTPGSETSRWSSNNAAHEKFPLMRRSSAVVAAGRRWPDWGSLVWTQENWPRYDRQKGDPSAASNCRTARIHLEDE